MLTNDLRKEPDKAYILSTLKKYELVNVYSPNLTVTRICHGAINRNFKVYDGEKTLLLKVFSAHTTLPVNRQQIFSMQEELAIIGLAPRPFFLSENNSLYCEQWIDVPADLSNTITHETEQLASSVIDTHALAEALYNVHSAFVSAPLLALDEHWHIYWQRIKSPSKHLLQRYEQVIQQWRMYLNQHRDDFVLCHNDLHLNHISFPNGPLFDWEYAGSGCRYFDTASCCAINNLDEAETEELCTHYAHLANQTPELVIRKVQEVSNMVAFTYELWGQSVGFVKNHT